MPSPAFLPQLAKETPGGERPRYDLELALILEEYLREQTQAGGEGYHFHFHNFLFSIVAVLAEELPAIEERKLTRRSVEYLQGRIEWQLGLAARRPPRGWREGKGARYLTSGVASVSLYETLDGLGRRLVDFWTFLAQHGERERAEADLLLHGWLNRDAGAALARMRRALEAGPRLRLSTLAS